MLPRFALVLALAGCFTARTHADRPRATLYNTLTIAGGIAAAILGYEGFKSTQDSDGLGPFIAAMSIGGGLGGGAFMVVGGLAGYAFTYGDYEPTH